MKWRIKNKIFNVTVTPKDKKIKLNWPFYPQWRLLVDEVKAMEGYKFDPATKTWAIKNSPRNQYQLKQLEYPNKFEDWYQDMGLQPVVNPPDPFWPGQYEAVMHILAYHRVIIAYQMGMGKCLITYEALEQIQDPYPIWIVCPKNVILAWLAEWEKWEPNLDINQVHIFNYEKLQSALKLASKPPRCVIFDESVYLKNPNSKRSQLAKELVRLMREAYSDPYIINLCGTPAPKDPSDWHNQTELCQPGFLRESSPAKLRQRLAEIEWEETKFGRYPRIVAWKPDEVALLYQRLQGMVLVGTRKEERKYIELTIKPEKRTLQSASLIANQSATAIEALTKLREISDGFLYTGVDGTVLYFESPKLERLCGLLQDLRANEQTRLICYAAFRASVDKCVETATQQGWSVIRVDGRGWHWIPVTGSAISEKERKAQNLYSLFQSDNPTPIAIIGHPQSLGEGLSLPCEYIIFYSNDFNPKNRQQAEARSRNPNVTIYDLIHLDTDQLVLNRLKQGKTLQSITLGEIKNAEEALCGLN